jgi:uncharacterized protein (TIGR03086 family)
MTSTTTGSITDFYRRAAAGFTAVTAALTPEQRGAATPCEGWTVDDVVDHVVSTERDLLARMPFNIDNDQLTDWTMVRDTMQSALDDPARADHVEDGYFGPRSFADTVGTFYVMDLLVHTWDIARGAGLSEHERLDVADLTRARALLEPLGDAVRSPGIFGPAVEVPEGATDQDRFLAWTGRRP